MPITERTLKKWRGEALEFLEERKTSRFDGNSDTKYGEETSRRILRMTQELLDQHVEKGKVRNMSGGLEAFNKPAPMKRFRKYESLAGILQPRDGTRYEMVAILQFDTIDIVTLNDDFFDKITFIQGEDKPYKTFRGDLTNPRTIKAAKEMRDRLLKGE